MANICLQKYLFVQAKNRTRNHDISLRLDIALCTLLVLLDVVRAIVIQNYIYKVLMPKMLKIYLDVLKTATEKMSFYCLRHIRSWLFIRGLTFKFTIVSYCNTTRKRFACHNCIGAIKVYGNQALALLTMVM